MRSRQQSAASRLLEVVPVFLIVGMGVVGVITAMNILVSVAPAPPSRSAPSPSPTFTFPVAPSFVAVDSPTPDASVVASASLPPHPPTLVHSQVTDKDPAGVWYYYISYPAFVTGSTPWAEAIDAQILDSITSRVQQWQVGPASVVQVVGKKNTLTGDFVTELLTPSLASFTLTWVDDTVPDQSNKGVATVNFDLATGNPIAFEDVFPDPDPALAALSLRANQILKAQLGTAYDPVTVDFGTRPSNPNFAHWALTADGFKVTFNEAQVAAASLGTPSIVIPWSYLKQFMVSTGPVAQLAGF